jgi:L-aminopeptidase/D-esterase-like protein
MTGVSWIEESWMLAGPIAITNTHSVGIAHAGIISWVNQDHPGMSGLWLLPVAAETWDGYLNDIDGHHVEEHHVVAALRSATSGAIEEGSVGGGTGMNAYAYKAGSGTASRRVDYVGNRYTVGVFVQANFGRREELTITGVPVGRDLTDDNPLAAWFDAPPGAGSIIAVVATDAPLLPGQCKALSRRVTLGLGNTGTIGSHTSGDLFVSFSAGNPSAFSAGKGDYGSLAFIPWSEMDPFFEAVVQGCEEAVLNAMVANEEMPGRAGHRVPALPRGRVAELVRRRTTR